MADPPGLSSYPILATEVVRLLTTNAISKMLELKFEKLIDARLKKLKKNLSHLAPSDVRDIRHVGAGPMRLSDLESMRRSKGCRGINTNNVTNIAHLLVTQGFSKDFPLMIGIMPVALDDGSAVKEFRGFLIGGAHRLAAIWRCKDDWAKKLGNDEALLPWDLSAYTKENPPAWLDEVPVSMFYIGPEADFELNGLKMGQESNSLNEGVCATTFCDLVSYVQAMRNAGRTCSEVISGLGNTVKESQQRKVMAAATFLCSGRFQGVVFLEGYYNNYHKPGEGEVFNSERFTNNIARKARDPWLNAELTRETKDKDYGVNVFIVLLLHFQAVAREGRAPSLRDGLVVRVRTDSPFANSVGPYSEFLLGTLELIHTAVADRPDFCKVLNLGEELLPGVREGEGSAQESWPMDLAMAVVNKLLTDKAFLVERVDHTAVPFHTPQGHELYDPIVNAIINLTKTAATPVELTARLWGLPVLPPADIADDPEAEKHRPRDTDGSDSAMVDHGSEDEECDGEDEECDGEDDDGEDDEEAKDESPSFQSEDLRKGYEGGAKTLCYTGLSRVLASTVPEALQLGGVTNRTLQTVVLHEEDPKLVKTYGELTKLTSSAGLHPTPVIIGVRRYDFDSESKAVDESDDDDGVPQDFTNMVTALKRSWESALHKKSHTQTFRCPVSNSTLASRAFRHKTPHESFKVDICDTEAVKEREVIVIVFHDDDSTPQVTISPADPSAPWRKGNAGHLLLHGNDITLLVHSDTWDRLVGREVRLKVEENARQAGRDSVGSILNHAMSVEFYMSLFCRYHVEGTAILSTWDPCGVEQAAACRLGRDSLCFLGLSTKMTVDRVGLDSVPVLGMSNISKHMHRVLANLDGRGKISGSVPEVAFGTAAPLNVQPRRASAPATLPAELADGGTARASAPATLPAQVSGGGTASALVSSANMQTETRSKGKGRQRKRKLAAERTQPKT